MDGRGWMVVVTAIANRVAFADKLVEIQVAEQTIARLRERGAMARAPAGAPQGVDDF